MMTWRGSLPLDSTFLPEGDERYLGQPVELSMLRLAAVVKQVMARHPAGSVLISLLIVYVLRFISRYPVNTFCSLNYSGVLVCLICTLSLIKESLCMHMKKLGCCVITICAPAAYEHWWPTAALQRSSTVEHCHSPVMSAASLLQRWRWPSRWSWRLGAYICCTCIRPCHGDI